MVVAGDLVFACSNDVVYTIDVAQPEPFYLLQKVDVFGGGTPWAAIALADDVLYHARGRLSILELGPVTIDLDAASDTGTSDSDNVTADVTPTFNVPRGAPYVRIYRDGVLVSGEYETGPVTLSTQPWMPPEMFPTSLIR